MENTTTDNSPANLSDGQKQAILDFVRSHPDGVIATVSPDGDPQASVVYFSIDDDMNLSFTTKDKTRKAQNIRQHPRVSVAIYEADSQTVVKLAGTAREMADQAEVNATFRQTVDAADQTATDTVPPIARHSAGDYTAFTIKPDFIQMIGYGRGNSYQNALEHATDRPQYGNPN